MSSVQSAWEEDVHDIPMSALICPFMPIYLDEQIVLSIMDAIKKEEETGSFPPIDVLWTTTSQGVDYYYALGGYHRYEAYSRLQRQTIPAKLIRCTGANILNYVTSTPWFSPDLK